MKLSKSILAKVLSAFSIAGLMSACGDLNEKKSAPNSKAAVRTLDSASKALGGGIKTSITSPTAMSLGTQDF